jgi:hypothetical protein
MSELFWSAFRSRYTRLTGVLLALSALVLLPTGGCQVGQDPEVTSVEPSHGPPTGGTVVTILGSSLVLPVAVTFNDVAATDLELIHSRALTAVTPPGTPGPATIALIFADGGVVSIPNAFTYDEEELSTAELPLTITALTPDAGPLTGGTMLTIQGTNFVPESVLLIASQPALNLNYLGPSLLTATTPPGTAGVATVVLTTGDGRSTDYPPGFTYLPPDSPALPQPTVTAISPDVGPQAGGTTVTVQGTLFAPGSVVVFDEILAIQTNFVSSTILTAVTPAHPAGAADVTVVLPDARRVTLTGAFVFEAPPIPTIDSIAPANGPIAGGTPVTIQGSGFSAGTQVFFDNIAALSVDILSAQSLVAVTPPHAAGLVDVTVQIPSGSEANSVGAFLYVAPPDPTISAIDPSIGPDAGGTKVTITGTDFRPGAVVLFGAVAASSVSVLNGTTLTAVTPAHPAGLVDVTVTNSDGASITYVGGFTFAPPVALSFLALSPASGPETGGTQVTLLGAGFVSGITVTFGGSAATVTVLSQTLLTAITPPGAALVDVVLSTPDGQVVTAVGAFQYIGPAVLSFGAITPPSGPEAGDTQVTILGTGFLPGMTVTFGGSAASVTVLSDTLLTAITPPGVGVVDVVLTTPDAQVVTALGAFEYIGPDVLSFGTVEPEFGPMAGGTQVTILGTGFVPGMTVTFDGVAAAVTVLSETLLTAITPPGTDTVNVVLATDTQTVTAYSAFTYVGPVPTISGVTPASGPESGGTAVIITGTGFMNPALVLFGMTPTIAFALSDTQIITISPGGTGTVPLAVVTPFGAAAAFFTYIPPDTATIGSLSPSSGPDAGGTIVTIVGTALAEATAVTFGGAPAVPSILSDTQLQVATPPLPGAGTVVVQVQTPYGNPEALFTYVPPDMPTISGLTPPSGPEAGGTVVTITGTGFTENTNVRFDGTLAPHKSVLSDTLIQAETPPGTGVVRVRVIAPNGDAWALFTYVPPGETSIGSLTPTSGPEAGGTTVLIEGVGFTGMTGASAVQFGSHNATSYTVLRDTQLLAVSPAGSGTVALVVNSPTGQAAALFTYIPEMAPPPTVITSITPASGPQAGGTTVLIEGLGFTGMTGASAVQFGSHNATSYTLLSDTQLLAVAPAGTGMVALVVTSPTGQAAALFTYIPADPAPVPPPTAITSVTPARGPQAGGTTVLIEGVGFTGMTQASDVQFDGHDATSYTVLSDAQLLAVSPPGTGMVALVVTSPAGQAAALFTYVPPTALSISSLSPGSALPIATTVVTVTGTALSTVTSVTFAGAPTTFVLLSDTALQFTAPPHAAGVVTLTITDGAQTAEALFRYGL